MGQESSVSQQCRESTQMLSWISKMCFLGRNGARSEAGQM